jgi:hypothetical protein
MGVVELIFNIGSFVILAWICILFYYAIEDYQGGNSFCFSKTNVDKTNQVFVDGYNKVKSLTSTPENFEERELNPHSFDYFSGEDTPEGPITEENTMQQPYEEEDYNDTLVKEWLDDSVVSQHLQYLKESNQATSGASVQVERSDRQDIVPQMGLRRIKYGKDLLSKNAINVPSFLPEEENTSHTNFYAMVGGQ